MAARALPALLTPLVVAGVLAAGMEPAQADLQCTATFSPDSVLRGAEPVNVTYGLSEQIGGIQRVMPDEGSGIVVTAVDSAQSMLTIDTNAAEAGSWRMMFHGSEQKTCTGTIHVAGMDRTR